MVCFETCDKSMLFDPKKNAYLTQFSKLSACTLPLASYRSGVKKSSHQNKTKQKQGEDSAILLLKLFEKLLLNRNINQKKSYITAIFIRVKGTQIGCV